MRKHILALILLFSAITLFDGCSTKPFADIKDIMDYSQNPADYLKGEEAKVPGTLVDQETIQNDFDARFFAPWNLNKPPYTLQEIKWPWRSYKPSESFGENMRPIDEGWFKLMLLEAHFDTYGSISKPGIVIRTTDIRNFPSTKPLFKDYTQAGEGYPFDYNQNSITTSNEPILISHYSKTKEWAYIFTSYTSGWVKSHDVALIGPDIIRKWSQARQTILIKDDLPLYDTEKRFVANSRIGVMLPIMKVEDDAYQGILATSKTEGQVTFTIVRVPKDASISTPLTLSNQAIAIMANEFMNKPYGWGGIYENRDCSSTIRDIFQPFGLWLPRNSKQQGAIGRVYDLSKLKPKQKEDVIIQNGLPFQTLLYKPGHIMLYIGTKEGKAMILHNIWGITTKSKSKEGRNIVGRTVITTLEPGKELSGFVKKKSLLHEIQSMNVITMQPTKEAISIKPKKEAKKSKRKSRKERLKEKEEAEKKAEAEAEKKAKEQPKPENDPKNRPKKEETK